MNIERSETSLDQMAALDKGIARRVKQAVERFAAMGAGNVKRLQGFRPAGYRLRVGEYRVRFHADGETMGILRARNCREAYLYKGAPLVPRFNLRASTGRSAAAVQLAKI